MARADLPREARVALDYDRLVATLDLIEGEPVIVRITSLEDDGDATAGIASIVGELRHQVPARYPGDEFAIGRPYPDREPEHLAGGIIFLRRDTLVSAALTTFDGNDYFIVSIRTRGLDITVQGVDSTYP